MNKEREFEKAKKLLEALTEDFPHIRFIAYIKPEHEEE